jgi:triosephosphate isomerase
MTYTLLVNLKSYRAATDTSASTIVDALSDASTPDNVRLVTAVNPVDLRLARSADHDVFAQHVDPASYGSHTGHVIPESASKLGAEGTLVNHSECQRPLEVIEATVDQAQDTGLETIVCAPSPEDIKDVAGFQPDFAAVEPPELIGGDTSVSAAQPAVISDSVAAASHHEVPVLCGAGVKTAEDVSRAVDLGAQGILVASGVVKAPDPTRAVEELARGFTV